MCSSLNVPVTAHRSLCCAAHVYGNMDLTQNKGKKGKVRPLVWNASGSFYCVTEICFVGYVILTVFLLRFFSSLQHVLTRPGCKCSFPIIFPIFHAGEFRKYRFYGTTKQMMDNKNIKQIYMYLSDALKLRATCSLCNNSFDISNMGESAVGRQ